MLFGKYNGKSLNFWDEGHLGKSLIQEDRSLVSEVRLLIQVSRSHKVNVSFVRLLSYFGIMKSWLYSGFWAANHQDAQEQREIFSAEGSVTL